MPVALTNTALVTASRLSALYPLMFDTPMFEGGERLLDLSPLLRVAQLPNCILCLRRMEAVSAAHTDVLRQLSELERLDMPPSASSHRAGAAPLLAPPHDAFRASGSEGG